jgi:hypothetical protein
VSAETEQLRRLLRMGFQAQQVFDADGGCQVVWLQRESGDRRVREVVLVYAYTDDETAGHQVLAYRARIGFNPEDPFGVPRGVVLWIASGDLVSVTHRLLVEPLPGSGSAIPPIWTPPESR